MQSESTPDANKQILRRTNCTDWACSSPRIAMTDTLLEEHGTMLARMS
jgi:hypothetical protein